MSLGKREISELSMINYYFYESFILRIDHFTFATEALISKPIVQQIIQ